MFIVYLFVRYCRQRCRFLDIFLQ